MALRRITVFRALSFGPKTCHLLSLKLELSYALFFPVSCQMQDTLSSSAPLLLGTLVALCSFPDGIFEYPDGHLGPDLPLL